MSARLVTTDVLVVGGGLAGERCAIEAAAAGHEALILSLVPPRRSHSCAAQGGMQASLANCARAEGDNPTVHFLDTVRGSDWGARGAVYVAARTNTSSRANTSRSTRRSRMTVSSGSATLAARPSGAPVTRLLALAMPHCMRLTVRSSDSASRCRIARRPFR